MVGQFMPGIVSLLRHGVVLLTRGRPAVSVGAVDRVKMRIPLSVAGQCTSASLRSRTRTSK